MLRRWPEKESDLGPPILAWLAGQEWETWQEVQYCSGGPIADIVARKGPLLWVVEMKRAFSLDLLDQGERWCSHAHFVSVATPAGPRRCSLGLRIAKSIGVGVLTVSQFGVSVVEPPPLHRRIIGKLADALIDERRTYAPAGNAEGRRWSPWAETNRRTLAAVRQEPGLTMKGLMDRIDHHYSSDQTARACIARWAAMGKVPGVRVQRDGRMIRLYPVAEASA